MNHAKEVEDFVHKSFAMYGLKFDSFFNELVDECEDEDGVPYGGELVALPIAIGSEIDMDLLEKAATTIGVTTDTLLNMDEQAAGIWRQKYPYFELKRQFDSARDFSLRFRGSPGDMVIAAIFDENYHPDQFKRFNRVDIKERLLKLLKEYSSIMPECYHENADVVDLSIRTSNFTHFEKTKDMAESYLSMVERARELFYKLWDVDLSEREIREYNFLVSVLGMRDVGYAPGKPIYYKIAKRFAPVYKQEGFKEYSSYIMYRNRILPELWTCKEFYDYPDLVAKVVHEFPEVKAEMSKMVMLAENYLCSFAWSDEPTPTIDVPFEEYLLGILHAFGDNSPSQYRRTYVPKTAQEIGDDEPYIERCKQLTAPPSKGGLILPKEEPGAKDFMKRIMARPLGGMRNG